MLDFEKRMLPHFENGLIETIFDSEYDLEKIGEAHARMESNANTGKILIKVSDDNGDSSCQSKQDLWIAFSMLTLIEGVVFLEKLDIDVWKLRR